MKTFAALASSIGLFAAASPAFADDVAFSYKRSELSSAAAVAALHHRLERKAVSACYLDEKASLVVRSARKKCAESLADELVAGIDNARLTALHEERHADRLADSR